MSQFCRNGHPRTPENTYVWRRQIMCQECRRQRAAEHRARDPEKARLSVVRWYHERGGREHTREYIRAKTYGITPADYKRLLLAQGGVCGICGQQEERLIAGVPGPLSVDHDHVTGEVRGLLCSRCNTALGLFRDDPAILEAAIRYASAMRKEVRG